MKKIVFDSLLYRKDALYQAIADYQELAHIQMAEREGEYICIISDTKYDLEETRLEFENYVLELTVSMGETHNDIC